MDVVALPIHAIDEIVAHDNDRSLHDASGCKLGACAHPSCLAELFERRELTVDARLRVSVDERCRMRERAPGPQGVA